MVIEIKELIIRAIVTDEKDSCSNNVLPEVKEEDIISTCVEQVLKIIDRSKER